MSEGSSGTQAKQKRVVNRSPKHPAMDLETAIDFARTLHNEVWQQPISADGACRTWDLSYSSSTGKRTLSALLQYGLLSGSGSGDSRMVRITDRGRDLVMGDDGQSDSYDAALQAAALQPTIFKETWEEWGPDLPADDRPLSHWLVRERGFNPRSTEDFIRDFRDTMKFARVDKTTPGAQINHEGEGDKGSGTPADKLPLGGRSDGTGQRDRGSGGEAQPMPSTGAATKRDWDLTIPLVAGGQAVLRIPIPVTPEDFELLKGVITSNLDAMRRAIVREGAANGGDGAEE